MKSILLKTCFILITSLISFKSISQPVNSPVGQNGRLKVSGIHLLNECGKIVQLKGIGTNGIMWFPECYNQSSLTTLANDWSIDIFEIKVNYYDWYVKDSAYAKNYVDNLVEACNNLGVYCIIELQEGGNPNDFVAISKAMFQYFSTKHKNKKNVLYEIMNEPSGPYGDWDACKSFCNKVIPSIRVIDPNNIIIVPTPFYCQRVDSAAKSPLTGPNSINILYSFHFYAASHGALMPYFNYASDKIPLIADEWGLCTSTGSGNLDTSASTKWINMMAGNNPGFQKVSWANHNFSDNAQSDGSMTGSCSALLPGSCHQQAWNNTGPSGKYIKYNIMNPNNTWSSCALVTSKSEIKPIDFAVNVFPNPNNGVVNFEFDPSDKNVYSIEVMNQLGEITYLKKGDPSNFLLPINIEKKGLYLVKIYNEKYFITKKLILQ
jgi:endoglucanase